MVTSAPMFSHEIRALAVLLFFMSFVQTGFTGNITALEKRDDPSSNGVGLLLNYCDDDWSVVPKYWFYGKCGETTDKREWHHIDLTNCYTVTDSGILAADNYRRGGMAQRCDRCSRCADVASRACLECRCDNKYQGRSWSKTDMDGFLFWDGEKRGNRKKVCCGEWWGGPYCGDSGMPPEPTASGIEYYLQTEVVG